MIDPLEMCPLPIASLGRIPLAIFLILRLIFQFLGIDISTWTWLTVGLHWLFRIGTAGGMIIMMCAALAARKEKIHAKSPKQNSDDNEVWLWVGSGVCGVIFLELIGIRVLGILKVATGLAAVSLILLAVNSKDKDKQEGLGCGAVVCVMVFLGLVVFLGSGGGEPGTRTQTNSHRVHLPQLSAQAQASEIADAYRNRTVHIRVSYQTRQQFLLWEQTVQNGSTGSGVILANDRSRALILTNRHVIDPGMDDPGQHSQIRLQVKVASERQWDSAQVVAMHRSRDLALVMVRRSFDRPAAITVARRDRLRQGEEVVALGNPLGLEYVVTQGILSASDHQLLLHSAPISPGNSGGPLLLKRHGHLAGINTLYLPQGQNMNGAEITPWDLELTGWPNDRMSRLRTGSWNWIQPEREVKELLKLVRVEK